MMNRRSFLSEFCIVITGAISWNIFSLERANAHSNVTLVREVFSKIENHQFHEKFQSTLRTWNKVNLNTALVERLEKEGKIISVSRTPHERGYTITMVFKSLKELRTYNQQFHSLVNLEKLAESDIHITEKVFLG